MTRSGTQRHESRATTRERERERGSRPGHRCCCCKLLLHCALRVLALQLQLLLPLLLLLLMIESCLELSSRRRLFELSASGRRRQPGARAAESASSARRYVPCLRRLTSWAWLPARGRARSSCAETRPKSGRSRRRGRARSCATVELGATPRRRSRRGRGRAPNRGLRRRGPRRDLTMAHHGTLSKGYAAKRRGLRRCAMNLRKKMVI